MPLATNSAHTGSDSVYAPAPVQVQTGAAPGLADRYLASNGYTGQMTNEPEPADAPANLFAPVPGDFGAHGRFGRVARSESWEMLTSRHRDAIAIGVVVLIVLAGRRLLRSRR